MSRWPLLLSFVALSTMSVACFSSGPDVKKEEIDLSGQAGVSSSIDVDVGDRVDVSVDVEHRNSFFGATCGKPTVFDSFGNELAVLSPVKEEREGDLVMIHYDFAFFPAAKGEYTLGLDNRECNVPRTDASATVTWTVHGG